MTNTKFPIIADDEIMLTEMPVMNLYDESDFISNRKGDYQDKNYLEWSPITEEKKQEEPKPLVKPIEKKEKRAPCEAPKKPPPGREVNILPTRRVHIHMQATATKLLQQPDITAAKHRRHYRPYDTGP